MTDSSEWELSKENVQPLREGRKIAALTSALQHTPTDLQHLILKDQRNFFEQQLRIYDGEDSLEVWDSYIKWTEQNFPRGGKDGNLLELLQRCLTHFQDHEGYKNDPRFVHLWIKFANFSDDPVEIYQYMFDQKIGCGLAMLYEDWANFVECLGNTKKADSIYLEGISRGAQPLDALKLKHSEFQMRVARGICLQPREEVDETERMAGEEQRTVLGGLRADKKNRVGATRTGTAKLGMPRGLGSSVIAPKQVQTDTGFQVFQDENTPMSSAPQQTGEQRSLPVREKLNRENEQVPGVWTKARAPQRKGIAVAAATTAKPTFQIHEDENAKQDHHRTSALVDSHVLSTRKTEKPGHLLDPIRKEASADERPMYCKEKVYCGTQEFSFEELRALKYFEKKNKKEQEEEQKRMANQLKEMRLMRDQFQKDLQNMKAEHRQFVESQRQLQLSSQESSGIQPSPMPMASLGQFQSAHNTPVLGAPLPLAPSSASFNASPSSAPSSASFSGQLSSGPSSASFHNPSLSAPSSASFTSSANSSMHRASSAAGGGAVAPGSGGVFENSSLNMSQRTPGQNMMETSVGSGSWGRRPPQQHGAGPASDGNSSKHSLSGASPTINTKEALQMVQGMYNATLDCDKINEWEPEDTEMTEGVQPPPPASIVVFDDNQQKAAKPAAVPTIFCDDKNVPPQENRRLANSTQKRGDLGYSGGRLALQEKPVVPAPVPVTQEFMAEEEALEEGTAFYPHIDQTLAAVGSQDSFAAAARTASTPFGLGKSNTGRLPSLPLSSIKPHKIARENSDEEMTDGASVQTNVSQAQNSQNAPFVTFNHTGVMPKDLSPIIEGSSEGSSEESHAASSLGVSSALKTPALPFRPAPLISKEHLAPLSSSNLHVIDTSHYVPAEMDEKTEALLSMSVCIDSHNPFDEATIKSFLKRISPSLAQREGYFQCNQHVPNFNACSFTNLGMDTYQLNHLIGEGGYAKVYHADFFTSNLDICDTMDIEPSCLNSSVIKVQKPAAPWEYYICSELHHRLQKQGLAHMRPCMMEITHGYFYQDGSCLVSDYCPLGSLLRQVNVLKKNRELMNSLEPLAAYLTIHLLRIVESLHRCHIIHGDIKPDNILITGFPLQPSGSSKDAYFGAGSQGLRLVDFGQAIDMTLYPPGTTFMAKVGTSGFQCIEMMTDQPWTYQTDMFGLAGSVHVLVFGQYMKVYCSQGQWNMTSNFQRKWKVELWKKLFHQLLNITDFDHQPDLGSLRREFEEHFMSSLAPHFSSLLLRVRSMLTSASSSH